MHHPNVEGSATSTLLLIASIVAGNSCKVTDPFGPPKIGFHEFENLMRGDEDRGDIEVAVFVGGGCGGGGHFGILFRLDARLVDHFLFPWDIPHWVESEVTMRPSGFK